MPDLDWNKTTWDGQYDWKSEGEEWSAGWGGSEAQWFGSLLPRLHRMLPTRALLEIAPGFGRWTRFLLPACQSYTGIDISEECVNACRNAFSKASHARFVQNDGLSLAAVDDGIDFVFSFDSLVHVEIDVLERYIEQIIPKLNSDGVAFVHHSNMAELSLSENPHFRARSVSGRIVAEAVQRCGGVVHIQEMMNWGSTELIDCMTIFGKRPAAGKERTPIVLQNRLFMTEAEIIRLYQSSYSTLSV